MTSARSVPDSTPLVVRVDLRAPRSGALAEPGRLLREGGLVAFPTETVYGLGADALNVEAVRRIFVAKGRPVDNPLIVHVADRADLHRVAASVTPLARSLVGRFWPGPLTLVVTAGRDVPVATRGGLDSVAVRMPDHAVALALIRAAGTPIAAPSANRSGRPSPTTAQHVIDDLGGMVDAVVDAGPCAIGVESTVVDARGETAVVLRDGAVSREQLDLGRVTDGDADRRASPGTRHRHYAPRCRVEVVPPGEGAERAADLAAGGRSIGLIGRPPAPERVVMIASAETGEELARILFAGLRRAEDLGCDTLVVEAVPEEGIGRAVMDRLRRAAESGRSG